MPAASSKVQKSFDYASLDAETSQFVQEQAGAIHSIMKRTVESIFEIGHKLIEVKERLGHGRFGDWLEAEFAWTDRMARKFMQVAETFKSENFSDLPFAPSALYELAAPSTPEQARLEAIARAEAGEPITNKTAKALKQKYVSTPKKSELEPKPEPEAEQVSLPLPKAEITQSQDKRYKSEILALVPRTQARAMAATALPIQALPSPAAIKHSADEVGITASVSESAGTWWQIDGKHLLFCGEPNSLEFQQRLTQQVPLLFAFPTSTDWQPIIEAQNRIIMSKLPTNKKWEQLEEVLEAAILYWWKGDNFVVSCFVPSVKILTLFSRLSCRGVLAEPNEKYCREIITDWRKLGGKVEQLSAL